MNGQTLKNFKMKRNKFEVLQIIISVIYLISTFILTHRSFYCLGIGLLILWDPGHFLGNVTFDPLERILSSGNQTTYPLGIGPSILWDSGQPLGNGT